MAGFLVGMGAGVAIGLLCAPTSGAEARRAIAGAVKDQTDSIKQQASTVWDTAQAKVEETKAMFQKAQSGLMNAADAGRKAYQETTTNS